MLWLLLLAVVAVVLVAVGPGWEVVVVAELKEQLGFEVVVAIAESWV